MPAKPMCQHSREVLPHVNESRPVEVYRNLHKKCLSVRQDGIVVCHTNSIVLKNAKFVVREKGRDRVRAEKKKNVHAFVKGHVRDARETDELLDFNWDEVYYDPYTCDQFECEGENVREAQWVDLEGQPSNISPAILAFNIG